MLEFRIAESNKLLFECIRWPIKQVIPRVTVKKLHHLWNNVFCSYQVPHCHCVSLLHFSFAYFTYCKLRVRLQKPLFNRCPHSKRSEDHRSYFFRFFDIICRLSSIIIVLIDLFLDLLKVDKAFAVVWRVVLLSVEVEIPKFRVNVRVFNNSAWIPVNVVVFVNWLSFWLICMTISTLIPEPFRIRLMVVASYYSWHIQIQIL